MITQKELALFNDLAKEFYDYLSSKGCNDKDFPDDWTEEEKEIFCSEFWRDGSSIDFQEEHNIFVNTLPDYAMWQILIDKINLLVDEQ